MNIISFNSIYIVLHDSYLDFRLTRRKLSVYAEWRVPKKNQSQSTAHRIHAQLCFGYISIFNGSMLFTFLYHSGLVHRNWCNYMMSLCNEVIIKHFRQIRRSHTTTEHWQQSQFFGFTAHMLYRNVNAMSIFKYIS